ncbi:MAG: VCBS repeat-containing protein, partial [Phycisphaerales bacterium]|nr:VCBS repeat-containing protein [Phycisphaerales bacterium]
MATQRGQRNFRSKAGSFHTEALEGRRMLDATITAHVFHDYNGNGVFNPGAPDNEVGASNYRVYIDVNDNGQYDAGVDTQFFTDSDGDVTIGGLTANTQYKIAVAPRDDEGTTTAAVKTVTTGADNSTTNAGDYGIGRGRITGRVWVDANGNGSYNAGEGTGSVRVYLDLNENGELDDTDVQTWTAPTYMPDGITPNPNAGNYRFNYLLADDYDVRVFPSHFQQAITANPISISLGIQQNSTDNDFGLTDKAAIGGVVYNDTNGDGTQQGGETGINNARVYLDQNSNGVYNVGEPTALANSSGVYVITAVNPGTYTVRVVLPDGYISANPASRQVAVAAGQETTASSFGLVSAPVEPVTPNDFNGDDKSDIIVTDGGVSTIWYMDGTTRLGTAALPSLGAGYALAAYGDFNGDGKPDLLAYNASTGSPKIITLNGISPTSQFVLPSANTQWKPVGAGDFDGDGHTDIAWRNQTTGQNTTWLMHGTGLANFKALPSTADNNWYIAGVADYNNDGKDDLVWRHSGNGRNTTWLLNGTSTPTFKALPSTADQNWRPVAISAFNGDNIPDILWLNNVTHDNSIWFMTAGQ